MRFIPYWLQLKSVFGRRGTNRSPSANRVIELLEERLTPAAAVTTVSPSLIDYVPAPLPPISVPPIAIPPIWVGGQPPIANPGNGIFVANAYFSTSAGQTLTVSAQGGLLSLAIDFDGNNMQVAEVNGSAANVGSAITLASGATLTVNADGSLTYVPASGFQGSDTFNFTVSDGTNSTTATANINVSAPQIILPNANYTDSPGQTLTVDAANGLLNGAIDPSGAALQVTGISAAGNLPSSLYWDSTHFGDGFFLNSIGVGGIDPGPIVFFPPGGGGAVTGTIGQPFSLPSGSTITVNADGSFTYVPATGFTGDDTFSFTVSDGTLSATASCDISVTAPQLNIPDAYFGATTGQTLTVNAANGLLANAYDSSGATVSVTAVNGTSIPAGGTATVTLASGSTLNVYSDGSFIYTPIAGFQGDDTFTFTASDGTLTTTANGDISVAMPQLNVGDASYVDGVGQTLSVDNGSGLLSNVYDSSGNPLTVTAVNGVAANVGAPITLASGSTLTVNADGSFTYVPASGFQGDDTFTFTVSDGIISATGNGDVNVSVPQITVANPSYTAYTGITLTLDAGGGLLSYASDSVNNPMTVTAVNGVAANVGTPVTLASGATVTVNADGSFTYVPAAGFQGSDSFDFTISDGATTAIGTASINVETPQLAVPNRFYGSNGQSLTVTADNGLLAWVQDPTGAAVEVTAVNGSTAAVGTPITLPSGATLTVNADGSFTYVFPVSATASDAIPSMTEGDSFTFTVSDGTLTSTGTATVYNKYVPIALPPIVGTPTPIFVATTPIVAGGISSNNYTLAVGGQAQSATVAPNATVTLTATTSGTQTDPVQWQFSGNNGKSWSNVQKGDGSIAGDQLTVTAGNSTNNMQYRAQIGTGGKSAQTTSSFALNVATPPKVTVTASTLKPEAGQTVTLTATVKGSAPTQVQWQSESPGGAWTDLGGATSLTYSFTADASNNGNRYRVEVTNAAGNADSTPVTLTVTTPPTVTQQPTSQTVTVGTKTTFTAAATGTPAPSIQWQYSNNNGKTWANLQNGGGVEGVHSGTLTVTTKSGENGMLVRAVFTSTQAGKSVNADSSVASLTVLTPLPVVTTQPKSQTVKLNAEATFSAAATGSSSVQWQVSTDGGQTWTNVRGATSKTLRVKATRSNNGDEYQAVFTNAGGSTATQAVTITLDS